MIHGYSNPKDIDDYFNLKMFQPLYSTFHNYYNISGEVENIDNSYLSCLNIQENLNKLNESQNK